MLTSTMKQRITYVVKNPDTFTPEKLDVKKDGKKDSFSVSEVHAAKEHRITLGLDELPREVHPLAQRPQMHRGHLY
jgi:hypothetical protein